MNKQFTASEVRELVSKYEDQWIPVELTGLAPSEAKRLAIMLYAYADLLEAQERAVPVAWRQKHLAPDESQIGWILTETRPAHFYCEPLYTHPQAAQDAALYQELLMAVSKKFPNESRHETALRYIKQTELQSCEPKCDAAMAKESGR